MEGSEVVKLWATMMSNSDCDDLKKLASQMPRRLAEVVEKEAVISGY